MNTGDQNVTKLHRTAGTLLAVIVVPLAYFMGASQSAETSLATLAALVIGGYSSCLLVAFALVKIFDGWLPEDG